MPNTTKREDASVGTEAELSPSYNKTKDSDTNKGVQGRPMPQLGRKGK